MIATILTTECQTLPPTITDEFPNPACDLDYVPNTSRPSTIDFAFKNSFGFGGKNSALVIKKFER